MESINIENLSTALSQKQKQRLDSILLIINSNDKSNEEKEILLRKRNKKDLQKVSNLLGNIRKTFVVFTLSGRGRVFNLEEFESRNKDYIDKNNLIRIYLGEQPRLSSIEREPLWFESLLQCFVLELLPLYQPNYDKVNTDFYKKFTVRELRKVLTRELENPLEIWNNIDYAMERSVSVPNLVRLYNLRNPDTPWRKNTNTTIVEIQTALGIQIPLEKDVDGIDKDIIIYYMLISGDRDSELAHIKSSIIYEKLGFIRSPQTIQELFRMDTQTFNTTRNFVRGELTRRWREIPILYGDNDESFKLGISRKVKYCYIANNIRNQHPRKNLTYTSHIDDLMFALQVIEENFG